VSLNLTGTPRVQITGVNAADFSVTVQPSSPVAASGNTTFTVHFDPNAIGLRSATISIANDDANENPYDFAIQGTGTGAPEMDLLGNSVSIADGDATPSTSDHTDFGSADISSGSVDRVFTIANLGNVNLNLTGSPRVQISGANAADFSVTVQPSSPVAASGNTTFTVHFNPSAVGLRSATISIANDDANENPYDFAIQGTGNPVPPSSVAYCSFSQGFYGNAGNTFNGQGVLAIIQNLLSSSSLVVGQAGVRSLTIPQSAADCIITRLPAGSTSSALPSGLNATLSSSTCQTSPAIPLQNSKWKNGLLGQTVALSLNARFDSDLASFVLASSFCTQGALPGPNGLLGDADDVLDPNSTPLTLTIPAKVLNALGSGATVADLINLANSGLAGQSTNGASLSDINKAVDAINRGFDGCRFLVACPLSRESENTVTAEEAMPANYALEANYPNPFNPTTIIQFALPERTMVSLKVYTLILHHFIVL